MEQSTLMGLTTVFYTGFGGSIYCCRHLLFCGKFDERSLLIGRGESVGQDTAAFAAQFHITVGK